MKRGERYQHSFWLTPDRTEPLVIEITRVTRDAVYYRGVYDGKADGARYWAKPENAEKWKRVE